MLLKIPLLYYFTQQDVLQKGGHCDELAMSFIVITMIIWTITAEDDVVESPSVKLPYSGISIGPHVI